MKIAYLMNQHPYASCTFIRREIAALESLGIEIQRCSIRRPETAIVDDADKSEINRTWYILGQGIARMLLALLLVGLSRPRRFLAAVVLAVKAGWASDRGMLVHLVYVVEACVLLRQLLEAQAQHIHAHFGTNATTVAMLCNALGGPPYSFTVHGPHEFDKPDAIALSEKIDRASFVVAVSSYGRSQLCRWCPHHQWSKLHVVHCGLDDDFLAVPPMPLPQTQQLVCVRRLCEQKGQMLLIEAASRLAADGVAFELVFVGDGELRGELQALIRDSKLEDRVTITGWQTEDQVRRHILDSRALVLPSFAEGLPVVIMEAFALARPVISTYVAGIPELVSPGHNGWLVPAGAVDELIEAMRQALMAPSDKLYQMGLHGRQRVLECHSASREAKQLAQLFSIDLSEKK